MRILHTMLRVLDLEKSIAFYTEVLGMKVLRRRDYPDASDPTGQSGFTLCFIGFSDDSEPGAECAVIELTMNWGRTEPYDIGTGFGHVAIAVTDAYKACELIKERGGLVTREAGPMKGGVTVIAFVKDPDGYSIELIQQDENAHNN